MDYGKIFKQSWKNVTTYRALWIFGIILALTAGSSANMNWSTGGGGGPSTGSSGDSFEFEPETPQEFFEMLPEIINAAGEAMEQGIEEGNRSLTRFFQDELGLPWEVSILSIVYFFLLMLLVFIIVGTFLRYISETALITMVDDQEEMGEKRSVRDGFRAGWSPASWRLFLIDLAISIPAFILFLALFLLVFAPLLLLATGVTGFSVLGIVLTSGFFVLFVITGILLDQLIKIFKQPIRRVSVLEGSGVFAAIRQGVRIVRENFWETVVVWLILVAINIAWPLVAIFGFFIFGAVAAVIGATIGLVAGLGAFIIPGASPIVVGLIVGGTIAFLLVSLPLLLLDGMRMVFHSSTWTLLYREFQGRQQLADIELSDLPAPEQADAGMDIAETGTESE